MQAQTSEERITVTAGVHVFTVIVNHQASSVTLVTSGGSATLALLSPSQTTASPTEAASSSGAPPPPVSTAPKGSAPTPASQEALAAGRPGCTRAQRLERAANAGRAASQVLRGISRRVPPTPVLEGIPSLRLYVVLVAAPNAVVSGAPSPSGVVHSWRDCRSFVGAPPADGTLFHGFASWYEAEAYWTGAGRVLPLPEL
jgi:hypothetical protein